MYSINKKKVIVLCGLLLGAALLLLWSNAQSQTNQRVPIQLTMDELPTTHADISSAAAESTKDSPSLEIEIRKGDTLSGLFTKAGLSKSTMRSVQEADQSILELDTLVPGNQLKFWIDDQGTLQKLELYFTTAHQVVFNRYADGNFAANAITNEGIWRNKVLKGTVKGSFYVSAKKLGLTAANIQQIESLLKEKINFAKDARAGDKFTLLVAQHYIDGKSTGENKLVSFSIHVGNKEVQAFQSHDGNFYDNNGQSLTGSFDRTPLLTQYRISSGFNPTRKHPVTGRVSPHNGTDFATPVGTKVVAPADGVVSLVVANNRFAGKYLVINHGNKYTTRYLHLSKTMVKKGQTVSRGQVIALTGNTGRTTGAHLHYELFEQGKVVNAMTASLPTSPQVTDKAREQFLAQVQVKKRMMDLG